MILGTSGQRMLGRCIGEADPWLTIVCDSSGHLIATTLQGRRMIIITCEYLNMSCHSIQLRRFVGPIDKMQCLFV